MKSIRYEKQILIVLLWSVLAFIGYNILTAEASSDETTTGECTAISEPDDYFYCDDLDWDGFGPEFSYDREWADELCDASEDYAKNPKNCDKAYKLVEEAEEKAAKEDAICDNEDASITNIKLCMSDEREQEVEERKELDKEMYTSKTFKNLLESKGIDYDDYKNDKLSSEKQDELETEFREDKSDEYAEEINKKEEQNDLPNKLSPFYNSEPVVEDWRNEVETAEGPPPPPPEQENYKIGSPVVVKEQEQKESSEDEYEESSYEYEQSSDESEESFEEEEEEPEEEEEEEETEEDSDSEGEE